MQYLYLETFQYKKIITSLKVFAFSIVNINIGLIKNFSDFVDFFFINSMNLYRTSNLQGDLNMLVFSDTGKAMHEMAEVI